MSYLLYQVLYLATLNSPSRTSFDANALLIQASLKRNFVLHSVVYLLFSFPYNKPPFFKVTDNLYTSHNPN